MTAGPRATESLPPRESAARVTHRLADAGHVAYFAGGCVRDRLLGLVPTDFDVATDATPQRVAQLFGSKARAVGEHFGVMLVRSGGRQVEVATFRSDGAYLDGRRPDAVTFSSPEIDAQRRDFTVNGLFEDPASGEVIDHVGGLADLRAGVLRAIGDADRRFREDRLRLLRAVRFAVRFGLQIHPDTWAAMPRHARDLAGVSAERVLDELSKIAAQARPGELGRAVRLMAESGLAASALPEWDVHADQTSPSSVALAERVCARLPVPCPLPTWLAAWLGTSREDAASPPSAEQASALARRCEAMCQRLRASAELTRACVWLARVSGDVWHSPSLADLRTLRGHACWPLLSSLLEARQLVTFDPPEPLRAAQAVWARYASAERALPPPLVNGDHLAAVGVSPGPAMGRALRLVYREQLDESLTSASAALGRALEVLGIPPRGET